MNAGPGRRAALLVAALLAAATLVSCSSGDGTTADPTTAASQQVDLIAPTVLPMISDDERQRTEAGATAFVLFWFDVLNYSLATNDVEALESYTNGGCSQCNGWLIGIARRKADGATLAGGLTVPLALAVGPFSQTEPVLFRAQYVNTEGVVTGADGTATTYPRAETTGTLSVLWGTNGWQMAAVELIAQ